MTPTQIKTKAEEMGISVESAIRMRTRYLVGLADGWDRYMAGYTNELPPITVPDILDEIISLRSYETRYMKPVKSVIDDEMIALARQYPVDTLVKFVRGKAVAWCHDDSNPSMFYGNRNNLAVCPVCDLKFGAIDICMERDGMSFVDAVLFLNGR